MKILELKLRDLGYKKINIYLNTGSSLFHTKLYRFKLANEVNWFIGSANSSFSAFNSNEEILLQSSKKHKDFEQYIEQVINESYRYDEIEDSNINSMVKFWRTGLIYYKPNANIQFTFSILKIPNWVKKELSQLKNMPPFATPGEPLGPFNLKLALGFQESDEPTAQARHNSWSIETCYGYWVPSQYKDKLDQKITNVSHDKLKKLKYILSKMEECGENFIFDQFHKYIQVVKLNLNAIYANYKWNSGDRIVVRCESDYYNGTVVKCGTKKMDIKFDDGDSDTIRKEDISIAGVGKKRKRKKGFSIQVLKSYLSKEFWRPPENSNFLFKAFVTRIFKRLNDERYINRSCVPFISSSMPEIWSDSVAKDDFSESFFEYISFKINMDSKPLVVKSFIDKCNLQKGDDLEDVQEKIESYINQYGWDDENWK